MTVKFSDYILLFVLVVFLQGCGGGGDVASTEPPSTVDDSSGEGGSDDTPESPVLSQPNILLIISDDQGLDASAQYNFSSDLPNTPTLNELAQNGLTFDNMWATPACSTTRATIITGKYGINNGVPRVPGNLASDQQTLQAMLQSNSATQNYVSAVFGKWHIGNDGGDSHPNDSGVNHYAGNLTNVGDYFNWSLTVNGNTTLNTEYHTTKITDLALEWMNQQNQPWFAWLAYSAPHSPFHLPPNELHNRNLSGEASDIEANRRDYYLAAIEAMDSEIGRLLDTLPQETRDNTLVFFIGDNGTPNRILDTSIYANGAGKGTLYQGGIAVPFIVSGHGVTRQNERESALVTATDIFATIAQVAGINDSQIHDSQSFAEFFSDQNAAQSNLIYSEFESNDVTGYTIRNAAYKLIEFENGDREMYELSDFSERVNLLPTTDSQLLTELETLTQFGNMIRGETSNENSAIDITNALLTNKSGNCVDYVEQYSSLVNDINRGLVFEGELDITIVGDTCVFNTNAIPNHDFNDGDNSFPNNVLPQNDRYIVTSNPMFAEQPTALSLNVDNAIMLNGVKVDLLAAGCFGVGNGRTGCGDMSTPWRYNPIHPDSGFRVDSHHAHSQADGTYHYHASPNALFSEDDSDESPVVGFAADGFPIFGPFIDDNGTIRKAMSSYRVKTGARPTTVGSPSGSYDGTFRDDFEYIEGLGDLDACNGMTINGVYGYYITDDYPYILGCFSGTPDASFNK